MAQLNDYIAADGTNLGVPNRPRSNRDPNGIARITAQNERGTVKLAYATWLANYKTNGYTEPFDYAGLNYKDEAIVNQLILSYEAEFVTSGSIIPDQSGASRSGTLVGATHDSTNDYFVFDGVNDYIYTPNLKLTPTYNPDTFSCAVWTYPAAGGVVTSIASNTAHTAYHFSAMAYLNFGGRPTPYFGLWNGTGITSDAGTALDYNNWYHMVLTYNGSTLKGYINGTEVASANVTYNSPYDDGLDLLFLFGRADTTNMGNGYFYNGRMGEMRVYSDALTPAEVTYNYNATKTKYGL